MPAVLPDNVKRPKQVQQVTQEQAAEYIKCQDDPEYFIENYVKITHIDKGEIPFDMYDYQRDMVNNLHEHRFTIYLQSRQSGKCLTKDINITVRNKKTGDVYEMPIGEFYDKIAKEKEQ